MSVGDRERARGYRTRPVTVAPRTSRYACIALHAHAHRSSAEERTVQYRRLYQTGDTQALGGLVHSFVPALRCPMAQHTRPCMPNSQGDGQGTAPDWRVRAHRNAQPARSSCSVPFESVPDDDAGGAGALLRLAANRVTPAARSIVPFGRLAALAGILGRAGHGKCLKCLD